MTILSLSAQDEPAQIALGEAQPSPCGELHVRPPRGYGVVARRAAPLLNQQCWCWGCDIRRPEGNLLLEYGFTRRRVPPGKLGSSAYTLELGDAAVVLWGFGLFWGQRPFGGVFLPRIGFAPLLMDTAEPPSEAFELRQLSAATTANSGQDWICLCTLLDRALSWVAGYETWVCNTCGPDYRVACVGAWRKRVLPAADMPALWNELAVRFASLLQSR